MPRAGTAKSRNAAKEIETLREKFGATNTSITSPTIPKFPMRLLTG